MNKLIKIAKQKKWTCPKQNGGQALVTLIFFAMIGMLIISAAAVILYTNTVALTVAVQGNYAYYAAESGVEEGLIRMLRDSNYTGSTFGIGSGSVTVEVQNGIITSTGTYGGKVRKIQAVTVTDSAGTRVTSWKEIN
jgi:hypothetical protein